MVNACTERFHAFKHSEVSAGWFYGNTTIHLLGFDGHLDTNKRRHSWALLSRLEIPMKAMPMNGISMFGVTLFACYGHLNDGSELGEANCTPIAFISKIV